MAVTLNFSSFFTRFNILDSEFKTKSELLAMTCLDEARLLLANDLNFFGSGDVYLNGETCHYKISSGGQITVNAVYKNANTFYWARVYLGDLNIPITAFKECNNLLNCP